jgi:DNA-binding Lrp family transcriptional regulator
MAERAYVFIETVVGRSRDVVAELREWEWVEFAERVTGPYDIVAIACGSGLCDVDQMVNDGLCRVDGIVRVVVCPISAGFQTPIPALPAAVH